MVIVMAIMIVMIIAAMATTTTAVPITAAITMAVPPTADAQALNGIGRGRNNSATAPRRGCRLLPVGRSRNGNTQNTQCATAHQGKLQSFESHFIAFLE